MKLLQIHEPGQTPLPHEAAAAVGIDLGTTNSVVAIASDEGVEVVHNIHGHALVPSVVYYAPDGGVEVGYPAKLRQEKGEPGAIASVKRLMGRGGEDIKTVLGSLPYDIAPGPGMARLRAGGREVTPVEVSAEILTHLKHSAERALGREVSQAVITVPAYFDDAARAATKDAARLAGLEVLRLINEPTAAALAYGLDKGAQGIYAIYDLGGGTFDISLLKLEGGVFQVLATGGDTALGGDDFDQAVAAYALSALGRAGTPLSGGEIGALVGLAREAKHVLTDSEETDIVIPPPLRGEVRRGALSLSTEAVPTPALPLKGEGALTLTRDTFNHLIAPYVEKTLQVCERALLDAKLSTADIKGVVMVGGSTRVPLVLEKAREFFGKAPLTDVNPDEVVAVGAALQARGLTSGSDNLLLDVVPLSLGLETMGGLTEKLIQRNTPIPVSVSQEFTTYQDHQTGMQFQVVQGEREMSAHNRSLARFELIGIPPLPAGIARVRVTFTVDADGLLSVSAQEKTTGARAAVHVKPSYGLPEGEIERMLEESMRHARKDITERLLAEARVEAERLIIELESAMAADGNLLEAPEKSRLVRQIGTLRNAMQGESRDYIDAEAQELGRLSQSFAERRMDRAINSALKGANVNEVNSG